ncbi:NACHT domain-containing protein [Micromonospora wenchangensis]|uniref:NACHT domain-containing protein n=1 Tax=Micromonospora wenchangensis TaxID=1185415 RepID=UPI0011835583|nr:hypothetical protein [Micromonospora wenchangensis]
MDFRLDGLSPRTFEHLVQSLAHAAITNEATPFGDGPDGGREATFDGPTNYGSNVNKWHGYGVIQAKFRQRPGRDDATWAENELKKELEAFSEGKRRRQIPDYYIYATNVPLTPALGSGGKDRVIRILKDFVDANNLQGYDIWDYDKIRILLIDNDSVRATFAAWITSGDVLFELARHLRSQRPDYYKIVINYLQKELLSDQFAKLEQAGHSADEAIPLSQVFVDLPVASEPIQNLEQPERPDRRKNMFAAAIVRAAGTRFVQSSNGVHLDTGDGDRSPRGRFVLIGGPGQGKTTLGQFICQIFRTALLQEVNQHLLDAPVRAAMEGVAKQWSTGHLPHPTARRMPFRIVLSEFAKMLADGEVSSILEYLTRHVVKRSGRELKIGDLKGILLAYPSLIILDGLDEVPASTNREQLLDCVRDFRVDVVTEQIDVLIVATSRPQGYNEDFSPSLYKHLYLEPLPSAVALDYAKRLTTIRFGQDSVRIDKVIARLERALKSSSTARLMRSPLQVTIMTLLVDRMGQPPQERWTLFSEYYNLIYQREIERDIPAASILRDYRADIDAIHRRVGLVLQIESERSGGTDSRLSTEQFSRVVDNYLKDEGHEGLQLQQIAASIIEAATNRLVFLVGLESGLVGFEIRSLQEFMAAEGLMDAEDGIAQARLRSIASVANWRNVFLFAAGKAFSDRRHLRDTIGQICQELNDAPDDALIATISAGSWLALDLLEDGPAARQPAMSRTLTRLALKLLDTDDGDLLNRLVSVYQERTSPIFTELLAARLGGSEVEASRAAIMVARIADVAKTQLDGLVDRAQPLLSKLNAANVNRCISIGDGRPGLIRQSIVRAITKLKPSEAIDLLDRRIRSNSVWAPVETMPPALRTLLSIPTLERNVRRVVARIKAEDGGIVGEISFVSVEQHDEISARLNWPDGGPEWGYLHGVASFMREPSKERLAGAIELASKVDPVELQEERSLIAPWVLLDAIFNEGIDWEEAALAARAGRFGDLADWREREEALAAGIPLATLHEHLAFIAAGRVSFVFDDRHAAEVLTTIRSHPELSRQDSIALGLYSFLAQQRPSDTRKVDGASWSDDLLELLFHAHDGYLGVLALEEYKTQDPASRRWEPHVRGFASRRTYFIPLDASDELFRILRSCWQREPSTELYPGFTMCIYSSSLNPDDFPQPELPITKENYGPLLHSALVLDLRRNGETSRVIDGIRDLDDNDPAIHRVISALRRRLDDAAFERELLLLHHAARDSQHPNLAQHSVESMQSLASRRKSNLMDESTWRELALPADLRLAILQQARLADE